MTPDSLRAIADTVGTPTYVYDANVTIEQYKKLHQAFNPLDVKLHYALKALNNINILRLLKQEGAGSGCCIDSRNLPWSSSRF